MMHYAKQSHDPVRQVVAMLHTNTHKWYVGVNRFAVNQHKDFFELDFTNRELVRTLIVHAEIVALQKAALDGFTDFAKSRLYVTLEPCIKCRGVIESLGISSVYYYEKYVASISGEIRSDKNDL